MGNEERDHIGSCGIDIVVCEWSVRNYYLQGWYRKAKLVADLNILSGAFGSFAISTTTGGGSTLLHRAGFIYNNFTNPWLPSSGSYIIRFLSPSTFSVFGFDTVALTNANNGNCVVKTV
jgi:hypothetical protein